MTARARALDDLALVYLLAGVEARRTPLLPRVRDLLASADQDAVARRLDERRLLPLIGSRAVEAASDLVSDSFRAAVSEALHRARMHGLAIEGATRAVVRSLGAAGVRALPLKGPFLAADAHGDIGLRQTSDVDVLVARGDLDDALAVLHDAGYTGLPDALRADGLPHLHYTLTHDPAPTVELHWRIYWERGGFSERLLSRATMADDGAPRAQPDDLVASLLLYHARDGFHGVRMAADLGAWWDRHGHELPPRFLEPHARAFPELAPALTAAALVAERLAGLPATGWLGAGAVHGRRVDLSARLADWTQQGDRDQLAANVSLVTGLLTPRGAGREFVARELTVPGAGAAASASHATKMCTRFALALWRLRAGRSWAPPP